MVANPRQKGGLPSIKRTLDGRADDNESSWSSNNLINIYDKQQSSIYVVRVVTSSSTKLAFRV